MNLKPKTKLKALGCKKVTDIDRQILNSKSIKIFSEPHPQNIRKNHGAQYFSQFLADINDKPRFAIWKENMHIVLIEIEPIQTDQYDMQMLKAAFNAFYLNINVTVLEHKLTLIKDKNHQYFLQNKSLHVIVPIQSFANGEGERINLSSKNIIRAQRELLKNYLKQTTLSPNNPLTTQTVFSSISFIDHPIVLECVPDNIITGRAQGYQGAVIGMKGCVKREIITTALHECLHVFSIDHCVWWDCIMNFSYEFSDNTTEGGSFHLCPSCLSKVRHQLGFDLLERYSKLYQFFITSGYKNDADFVQSIIKTF